MILNAGYHAIMFDLDGTLVDTMPLHYRAYARVFSSRGWELDFAVFMNLIGPPAREVIPLFVRAAGGESDEKKVAQLHEEKKAVFHENLSKEIITVLPAAQFLNTIEPTQKIALVTSGNRQGAEAILSACGWENRFDVTVTGDDVTCGKPDPEPYLLAAQKLHLAPEKCLAFEDTADGLASARAAGMDVVDVASIDIMA